MNIVIVGINYAPEMVGIGPYTAGMAEYLAAIGHHVTVIAAQPYYPQWEVNPAYAGRVVRKTLEKGVNVVRVPVYVPAVPSGARRVLHHMSFAARAHLALNAYTRTTRPDVIIGIAPSLISMTAAHHAARRTGARFWLHIQDFEVEAAFATGLLKDRARVTALAERFERWAIQADRVSTISLQMCAKLRSKGIKPERIVEFRNWANIDEITPLEGPSTYRVQWGIDRPHVALYSGNIANKQGIEIVVEAARALRRRKDLTFVVCGNGPNRARLVEQSKDLDNIQFHDLQPRERLSELLGMARVHLLPQIADAADLVLPSKLTNMLASGRPIAATAQLGTSLADEVEGSGLISAPGDVKGFCASIERLLDDQALHASRARAARERAITRWNREAVLQRFEKDLVESVAS